MTSVATITAVIPPSYAVAAAYNNAVQDNAAPAPSDSISPPAPLDTSTSTPIDPNASNDQTSDTSPPSAYDALANANSSTIRGANLNIQA